MKSDKKAFGKFQDKNVDLYILENDKGLKVKVMNYGATITSVTIPDQKGNPVSLVCGFDTFEEYFSDKYKANAPYFGSTIGRYCSQIKDAKFTLKDVEYALAPNTGVNNLHGGVSGFDKKVWNAQSFKTNDSVGVLFSLESPDGEEGFPGNVAVKLKMQINNENEIQFEYRATTDKATPLSLTNHSYFNLSGFKQNVEAHVVKVFTNKLQEMDDSGAGTGRILDVSGSINDLQKGKVIADVHLALGDGFEHFYVFENPESTLNKVAEVMDPESKRSLEVYSTEPCMLFYTGKYTSDDLQRNPSEKYGKYRGFCCETHRYQNGPNIPGSPKTITTPDVPFESTTVFKLKG